MKLTNVGIVGSFACSLPSLLVSAPLRDVPMLKWCKFELVQHLHRSGWTILKPDEECPEFHMQGQPKVFGANSIFRSKFLLHCLAMSSFIFKKPGNLSGICFSGVESYFKALLKLRDLSGIEALGLDGQKALRDKDSKFTTVLSDICL